MAKSIVSQYVLSYFPKRIVITFFRLSNIASGIGIKDPVFRV